MNKIGELDAIIDSYHAKIMAKDSNYQSMNHIRHNTFPLFNRTSSPALEHKPELFDYVVGHPVPYVTDAELNSDGKDIVVQHVLGKIHWRKNIARLQKMYKLNVKKGKYTLIYFLQIWKNLYNKVARLPIIYRTNRGRQEQPVF